MKNESMYNIVDEFKAIIEGIKNGSMECSRILEWKRESPLFKNFEDSCRQIYINRHDFSRIIDFPIDYRIIDNNVEIPYFKSLHPFLRALMKIKVFDLENPESMKNEKNQVQSASAISLLKAAEAYLKTGYREENIISLMFFFNVYKSVLLASSGSIDELKMLDISFIEEYRTRSIEDIAKGFASVLTVSLLFFNATSLGQDDIKKAISEKKSVEITMELHQEQIERTNVINTQPANTNFPIGQKTFEGRDEEGNIKVEFETPVSTYHYLKSDTTAVPSGNETIQRTGITFRIW